MNPQLLLPSDFSSTSGSLPVWTLDAALLVAVIFTATLGLATRPSPSKAPSSLPPALASR